MVRLVVCGIIFVLLVAVKLLFPDAVDGLAKSAGQLIGQSADFKEAFAAVGRAISGEQPVSDSLQDAYTAVFNPAPPTEPAVQSNPEPPQAVPDRQDSPDTQAERESGSRLVKYTAPALPGPDTPAISESLPDTGQEETEPDADVEEDSFTADTLSYVYTMPAPPENASLEQRNLGFEHTTPVQGVLSSTFGWREHPIEGGNKFHYGVDLAAAEGTDIIAFADGTVYATGESSSLGYYVMLQHVDGYITLYGHCSRVTVTGGSVSMGDKIAEVGSTGLSTGPHLHFELHDGDLYLNPIYYVEIG